MIALVDQVRSLLARTSELVRDFDLETDVAAIDQRMDEPLRVAIAGRVKAGKSTLLNALVGEQLAPTDAGECTKIVTWYRHGPTYKAMVELKDGSSRQARFDRDDGAINVDLAETPAERIHRIVIEWPSPRLVDMTLIDTPGVASINTDVSQRTVAFLTPDDNRPVEADAVLYLMRHMHAGDLSFLESFHDDEQAAAGPINAIGLLSRADEIGVGRPTAMRVAGRIAGRYRSDPRLRPLCQTVLPIAGLLAETATTLTEDEFRALEQLTELDRNDVESLMLSADRFVADNDTCPLPAVVRRHLVDRFGLYGIRVSLPMIRQGRARSAGDLADSLEQRSGMVELQRELLERFASRRDILRARSALLALEGVLSFAPLEISSVLLPEVERIRAGAHAFAEIRLLNDFRRGVIDFTESETQEVERLLGGDGTSIAARVGLPADAPAEQVRGELMATVDRWRHKAGHPLASRELTTAASVLIRSCEGALAGLDGR